MSASVWDRLAEPFPEELVELRPGSAYGSHRGECQKRDCRDTRDAAKHLQFRYATSRTVMDRLDDVLGPEGWDFTWSEIVTGPLSVHGRLTARIGAVEMVREDVGYPNAEGDDEPLKGAVSDALKRCAVQLGVGRFLYDDNKHPAKVRPQAVAHETPDATPPPREPSGLPHVTGLVQLADSGLMDGQLRQGPDGPRIAFRVKPEGRNPVRVVAFDGLAEALYGLVLAGVLVDVSGAWEDKTFTRDGQVVKYRDLIADRAAVNGEELVVAVPPVDEPAAGQEALPL